MRIKHKTHTRKRKMYENYDSDEMDSTQSECGWDKGEYLCWFVGVLIFIGCACIRNITHTHNPNYKYNRLINPRKMHHKIRSNRVEKSKRAKKQKIEREKKRKKGRKKRIVEIQAKITIRIYNKMWIDITLLANLLKTMWNGQTKNRITLATRNKKGPNRWHIKSNEAETFSRMTTENDNFWWH